MAVGSDRDSFDHGEYNRRFHSDFMYDATSDDDDGGSTRSPLFIILTALVLMAFGAVVWVAYQQGMKQGDRGAPQVIVAEPGPIRVAPENPGGVEVPDQDKQIYERIAGAEAAAPVEEALAPPPEQPRDLPLPPAKPDAKAVVAPPAAVPAEPAPADPGAAEEGDNVLAAADEQMAAVAQPSAEQVKAEEAARKQAAELTAKIEEVDPGAADAAAKSAASGAFVVQIGAYKQDAEAAGQWQSLKKKHGDLLGSLKPDIKRVDLGEKGVWYRLRVGPFATRADAIAKCEVLRSRGGSCIVGAP